MIKKRNGTTKSATQNKLIDKRKKTHTHTNVDQITQKRHKMLDTSWVVKVYF